MKQQRNFRSADSEEEKRVDRSIKRRKSPNINDGSWSDYRSSISANYETSDS